MPLPAPYVWGVADVVLHGINGHSAFLMGQFSRAGWFYYFPIAFVIKVPISLLILIGLTFLSFFYYTLGKRKVLAEYIIITFVLFYFIISLFNHINIGLRHLLPIFPFLFLIVSRIINCKKIIQFKFLFKISKIKIYF
jgi:hypothetical protein